ncbi:MAG: hypothetical protein Q9219_005741 [cf. Caloplaca sp. 3 TL-2023]
MAPIANNQLSTGDLPEEAPLPLISLEPLLHPSPETPKAVRALLSAFRTQGFFYLTGYSTLIPQATITSVFAHSSRFFARPSSQKEQIACPSPMSHRGYMRIGREKVSHGHTAAEVAMERDQAGEDMKETFQVGREGVEEYPNYWPDSFDEEGAAFKEVMQDFFLKSSELHAVIMRGIALGFGLKEDYFDDYISSSDNSLRLLHYPAVPPGGFKEGKKARAGAHTDYGTVTFLFQDQQGGLQVEKADGSGYMDVKPIENTIVVNAGDRAPGIELWNLRHRATSTQEDIPLDTRLHISATQTTRNGSRFYLGPGSTSREVKGTLESIV